MTANLQNYQEISGEGKNWNLPKIHSHQHGPKDIEAKGITANYNTKPYEKMHGSFKKSYLRCCNKRNVASQVSIDSTELYLENRLHILLLI